MRNYLSAIVLIFITSSAIAQPEARNNLRFDSLAKRWDDGIPIGNGWLGALIWQKENKLRISVDRVDLWDDRPMPGIDRLRFKWVADQVRNNSYDTVQKAGDEPYEKYPAPTKIPGAAFEFDLEKLGKVVSNELDIRTASNIITFENGVVFKNYIHAINQVGYFEFKGATGAIVPEIMIPQYQPAGNSKAGNSVEGQGLERLGYPKGTILKGKNFIRYHQPTRNGNYYEVLIQWATEKNKLNGEWTISLNKKAFISSPDSAKKIRNTWTTHINWWNDYWSRSSVSLPDTMLKKQYYLEMYKFGSVARSNTPPISLQAIWTADNGNLPPWKGDLHHDLNTELSYWPGYTGNHLDLTASFTNGLWKVRAENKKWTKQYFGVDGLNVPGVTTISGKAMGGWVQYSMSPTTAAWLAQHFFWQWKYSMDKKFLIDTCLPYFNDIKKYFSKVLFIDSVTHRYRLPLSSSPEYNDNSIKAWFPNFTNYDLALIKSLEKEYAEITQQPGAGSKKIISEIARCPDLDTNQTGLTLAPGQNLDQSHRHHAHLMAIYPLGLLNADVVADKNIIDKSMRWLEQKGTREWCGYSFSWAACLYASAKDGENAAKMLRIFATNFISTNSFHLNGDQQGGQYSNFTYRPFTLEGNFAFAQGIHEMLIQSNHGYIEVFPAIPSDWQNVSFNTLRTEGAFLVSAKKENGNITEIKIISEAGGKMQLKLPFKTFDIGNPKTKYTVNGNMLTIKMRKSETILVKNGFE